MARPAERRGFSLRRRIESFRFAFRGLAALLTTQHNAWIHAAVTLGVCALGAALGLSRLEWCWVVVAVALVWTAEAFNTAVELLCDVVSPEFHPLVERAKNLAAAGVLLSAGGAAAIGLLVLGPHLWRWLC